MMRSGFRTRVSLAGHWRYVPAVAIVMLLPALGGCVGPVNGDAPPAGPGAMPSLEEFQRCDWTYPDGSTVPCRSGFEPISTEAGPPALWVCVYTQTLGGVHWEIYRAPDGGGSGIRYDISGANGTVAGLAQIRSGFDEVRYFNSEPASAFLRFDRGVDNGDEVKITVYDPEYATEHPALRNATFEQLWSSYEDRLWVLHRADVKGQNYTFQQPNGSIKSWFLRGSDFDLRYLFNLRLDASVDNTLLTVPDPDCVSTPAP